MGLPIGFRYLKNMALYLFKNLKKEYIKDYGKDLESRYDQADKTLYKERIFCLDCPTFEVCRGRFWEGCSNRAEAMKTIEEEL
ncbi:MAG: hypothetical protein E3J83_04270 [Candidatus Atribacteria bacterium]|nr:MAG: hypothetical protein E3J83_04270 [Candidatus Atribacteria bacterium]